MLKKILNFNLIFLLISLASAYSYSLSPRGMFTTINSEFFVSALFVIILFGFFFYSLKRFFKENKTIAGVISLAASVLSVHYIKKYFDLGNIVSNIGIKEDTLFIIVPLLILIFLFFLSRPKDKDDGKRRFKPGRFFILLGILFLILSNTDLIAKKSLAIIIGAGSILLGFIIGTRKKGKKVAKKLGKGIYKGGKYVGKKAYKGGKNLGKKAYKGGKNLGKKAYKKAKEKRKMRKIQKANRRKRKKQAKEKAAMENIQKKQRKKRERKAMEKIQKAGRRAKSKKEEKKLEKIQEANRRKRKKKEEEEKKRRKALPQETESSKRKRKKREEAKKKKEKIAKGSRGKETIPLGSETDNNSRKKIEKRKKEIEKEEKIKKKQEKDNLINWANHQIDKTGSLNELIKLKKKNKEFRRAWSEFKEVKKKYENKKEQLEEGKRKKEENQKRKKEIEKEEKIKKKQEKDNLINWANHQIDKTGSLNELIKLKKKNKEFRRAWSEFKEVKKKYENKKEQLEKEKKQLEKEERRRKEWKKNQKRIPGKRLKKDKRPDWMSKEDYEKLKGVS